MWRVLAAATLFAMAGGAAAQAPPGSVAAHYRVYAAAEARGDYATARTAAVAALEAAERAQSPRVGALATNLARLLAFRFNDLAGAATPARRALEVGGEGVDPEEARLLVTLTELTVRRMPGRLSGAVDPLDSSLAAARCGDVLFCYEVARAWGYHAFSVKRNDISLKAYTRAVTYAERLGAGAEIELALALTGLGAAALYEREHEQSAEALNRAIAILLPLLPAEGASENIAERVRLTAIAWRRTLDAVSYKSLPQPTYRSVDRNLCPAEIRRVPAIKVPPEASEQGYIGTIVLRYWIDEDGTIRQPRIVASAPNADLFGDAVLEAVSKWSVEWKEREDGATCVRTTDNHTHFFNFTTE